MTSATSGNQGTAGDAQAAARDWVRLHGTRIPGFGGAWLAGSIAWQPADAPVPPWSDTDVMVVLDGAITPPKIGKLRHQGFLLEISFIPAADLATPDTISGNYKVSASFVRGIILADPTEHLTRLQADLARTYDDPGPTIDRLHQVRAATIAALEPGHPTPGSTSHRAQWVFPAGLPTHFALVATGENPTVRRRYEKLRPILTGAGRADLYEALLAATGYAHFTADQVKRHWRATSHLFDVAATVSNGSTRFFASDISAIGRPISIDGPRDSIERGFHREAVFWLVATQARSLLILEEVAPDLITPDFTDAFMHILTDAGIATPQGIRARSDAILALLPELERTARDLLPA